MGGHNAVQSVPGAGSEFSFELTLPLSVPPVARGSRVPFPVPGPLPSGRVLVVEDDRVNQRVIELLLEKLGLDSSIVADGAAAVDIATTEPWEAILME